MLYFPRFIYRKLPEIFIAERKIFKEIFSSRETIGESSSWCYHAFDIFGSIEALR
jgi:hypothetical protein